MKKINHQSLGIILASIHETSADRWGVRRIRAITGGVAIGTISGREDLGRLRQVTHEADTIYHFDPTRRQFKELVKQDGFSETVYLKQK